MANLMLIAVSLFLILYVISFPCFTYAAISSRNGSTTLSKDHKCQPSGSLTCHGKTFPTYTCSPAVKSSTIATLTNNDFSKGGGGGPSECNGQFHKNTERVVALSTGWYSGGSRCGKYIKVRARNGKSVMAKVVDECDSMHGCDKEHAGQPPCDNNIIDASDSVWSALGLNLDDGRVPVSWSVA
ncbi:Kiwellin [Quillaja saponaria]|uniref:Kiwellin n=1 Tax=Quillaja saponaria TaxID=32244 RepID=A0AAD7KPT8_QUISA|nr:Kiwellin [Quillaja saponaria]